MTLADLSARVAPDYARMLAMLARAMVPAGAEADSKSEAQVAERFDRSPASPADNDTTTDAPLCTPPAASPGIPPPRAPVASMPSVAPSTIIATFESLAADPVEPMARSEHDASSEPRTGAAIAAPATGIVQAPRRHRLSRTALRRAAPALAAESAVPPAEVSTIAGPHPLQATDQPRAPAFTLRLPYTVTQAKPLRDSRLPFAAMHQLANPPGVPLPLDCAWPLPNLLTPESRTSEPEPKAADPFADAALEDALSDLIERSALAGGIDL